MSQPDSNKPAPKLSKQQALQVFDEITREQRQQREQARSKRADQRVRRELSRMPVSWGVAWGVLGAAPPALWGAWTQFSFITFQLTCLGVWIGWMIGSKVWKYRLRA